MIRWLIHLVLPVCCLIGFQQAHAMGLGELRRQPLLGERLDLQIELVGVEKSPPDVACFRIISPRDPSDLPWVKRAELRVRQGGALVLEVRSNMIVREPILQLAVELSCGFDSVREYTMLVSPASHAAPIQVPSVSDTPEVTSPRAGASSKPVKNMVVPLASEMLPKAEAKVVMPKTSAMQTKSRSRIPAPAVPASPVAGAVDQLRLSFGGDADAGLQLSTELGAVAELQEAQRDLLRLEYRMLVLMHEQVNSQLAAAEKLRQMESVLGDLQRDTATLSQRLNPPVVAGAAGATEQTPNNVKAVPDGGAGLKTSTPVYDEGDQGSDWWLYGALMGGVLGVAGWLGWRRYQDARAVDDSEPPLTVVLADPAPSESESVVPPAPAGAISVDVPLNQPADNTTQVDFVFDALDTKADTEIVVTDEGPAQTEQAASESYAAANPVMELADIMLSFGRVKGAAQTLQEYIDSNPQDALQPWIRLMDVYRMAGMREEFEHVARNLNRHFNVEVQSWDEATESLRTNIVAAGAARMQSLEDIPRLMNKVMELWETGDVVGYLYELLRDNRGGERVGFAMPVVDDILFLIELKETANRME